tara:strand:- start:3887 stop:4531 length:645 start_codon:yes stop_codon:yes gene_type:complete
MANYTNCITLEQMEWLDLFDEIPYKVVKKLVKLDGDTDFEVEIKDLQHDDYNKCFTSFKFTLEIDISQGSLPLMVDKHYCVIKEYNGSSSMAMYIGENLKEEEEEEAPLCYRKNGSKCKWCDNLCVDEEDSLCHECYHKSNPSECYCDEEENSAWLKKQEEEECDDCEGKCRSNETETCENCAVKLRIGCGNNPSDESIFNGLCDDCREKEEEE